MPHWTFIVLVRFTRLGNLFGNRFGDLLPPPFQPRSAREVAPPTAKKRVPAEARTLYLQPIGPSSKHYQTRHDFTGIIG
jgi:hypothetical protein